MNTTTIWLYVFGAVLFYFYTKIKKQYKVVSATEPDLSVLSFIGRFLKTDFEDILLSIGIAIWILTGHTIAGFAVDLSNEFACITTGIAIPYLGVNVVLGALSLIPGINPGDRSRKRIAKKAN